MNIFLEIKSRFSYVNLRITKILNESLKCQKPYEVKMTMFQLHSSRKKDLFVSTCNSNMLILSIVKSHAHYRVRITFAP